MRRQSCDSFNFTPTIRLAIAGVLVVILFSGLGALAKVDAPSEFADDGEVCVAGDVFFQGGGVEEGGGGEEAGAEVAEGLEFFAEAEDALFGTDGGVCGPFLSESRGVSWDADLAEQDDRLW